MGVKMVADSRDHALASLESAARPPCTAEASVVVDVPTGGHLQSVVRADPMLAVVVVVLVALGVVGMALYAVQLLLKRRDR
jgi:hypothetical protein